MKQTIVNNSKVVDSALESMEARNHTGSFWTDAGINARHISELGDSWLSRQLRTALLELKNDIVQTIYSYETPIAFKINGVWLRVHQSFSNTTNTKHQPNLYKLPGLKDIMFDATADDIRRIVSGLMVFNPHTGKHGSLVAA